DAIAKSCADAALRYAWMGDSLGGLRRAPSDSRHVALRVAGFRGYAHHMETDAFRRGVDDLLALAQQGTTAVMCAEMLWWRCHRSMISDYLVLVRDVRVFHILDESPATPHPARPEARVEKGTLVYDVPVEPRSRS